MKSLTAPPEQNPSVSDRQSVPILNKSMSVHDDRTVYINGLRMFFAYHEKFGSLTIIRNLNHQRVVKWIESELKEDILERHFSKNSQKEREKTEYTNIIFILKDELMLDVEGDSIAIVFTQKSEATATKLEAAIRKLAKRISLGRYIHLVTQRSYGLDLLSVKSVKPKLDLKLNYNDDIVPLHIHLKKELAKNNKSGLVLLHGIPGTGKSTYIRYLINGIKKRTIFLPPNIAANLDSPSMTTLLVDNANSLFIIEDAEQLITSREDRGGSNISMLLNLTDGILGKSLGIQVICTFNTSVINIDKALLRKGRLIASYEFKNLCEDKTSQLIKSLGHNPTGCSKSLNLADIYGIGEMGHETKSVKSIGFLSK